MVVAMLKCGLEKESPAHDEARSAVIAIFESQLTDLEGQSISGGLFCFVLPLKVPDTHVQCVVER